MKQTDIAIIGIAGRFPQAANIDAFLENLKAGVDSVRPLARKRVADTGIDALNYQEIALLDDIDKFDHQFFDIALGEAQFIDPHQRMLLEVAYECFENAGYNVDHLDGSRTSVYLGDTDQQYYKLAKERNPLMLTGNLNSTTAGRIARFFNLTGNALMVDTACSSSLVAVHLACMDLAAHESHCALVGAANLILFPPTKDEPDETGIDSPDGRAKAFSAAANGTSNGEAVCCILLKRLADAERDRDTVYAVIKGITVNQDGRRSSSLTAPSSRAQAELITRVYEMSGINPESIGVIEAHGTGTPLGDPIEIEAIQLAFRRFTGRKQFAAISSVKTNIGHTDTAAGLAGLIKLVLSLQKKLLFPSLHFDEPNPFIDFLNSPVYVNNRLRPWVAEEGSPRRGGLSSFGISGTNCHAVVEERPAALAEPVRARDREYVLTVSAKTKESLYRNVEALKAFLKKNESQDFGNICYTLNTGRKQYPHRYSRIVRTAAEAIEKISYDLYNNDIYADAPIRQVWMLFPPLAGEAPERIAALLDQPDAQAFARELGMDPEDMGNNPLVFQWFLYGTLKKAGIETTKLVGIADGNRTIQVIKGQAPVDSLRMPRSGEQPDWQRASAFIQANIQRGDAVILMSPSLLLRNRLDEAAGRQGFRVIDLFDGAGTEFGSLLKVARLFYDAGREVQFSPFYPGNDYRKVPLPAYQFRKTRCWLNERQEEEANVRDWFYQLQWGESSLKGTGEFTRRNVLLVSDRASFAAECGRTFTGYGNTSHAVILESNAVEARTNALDAVRQRMSQERFDAVVICFRFGNDAREVGPAEAWALFHFELFKVIGAFLAGQPDLEVVGVLTGAQQVADGDEVSLTGHVCAGMYKALQSDYSESKIYTIDVADADEAEIAGIIVRELSAGDFHTFSAYRQGKRYLQFFSKTDRAQLPNETLALREKGLYVVTGGAQGVGAAVTALLAKRTRGTVLVIGQTPLPPKQAWQDLLGSSTLDRNIRERIMSLSNAEAAGTATIEYHAADVADPDALGALFASVTAAKGAVHGVFHLAGRVGPKVPLRQLRAADFTQTLAAKMRGTDNLVRQLDRARLDFLVLFSSFNSVIPQKNSVDYTAANCSLDAFAYELARTGYPVTVINWGAWGETGAGKTTDVTSAENRNAALRGWSTADGLRALVTAMANAGASRCSIADINLEKFPQFPFFETGGDLSAMTGKQHDQPRAEAPDAGQLSDEARTVLDAWRDVLKKPVILLDDNFFELGGHSLLAARIINLINRRLGVKLTFRDIFAHPTIRTLAAFLRPGNAAATRGNDVIPAAALKEYYVTSPAQQQLWASHAMGAGQTGYNLVKALRLEGALDRQHLQAAIEAFMARHEVLRTTFHLVENEVMQQVHAVVPIGQVYGWVDLSADGDKEETTNRLIGQDLGTRFELDRGPLMRVKVFRWDAGKYVLSIAFHHLISDAWSAVIMPSEIMQLYNELATGEKNPLPPIKVQYKDYAEWTRKKLADGAMDRQKQYWEDRLRTASVQKVPVSVKETPGVSMMSGELGIEFDQVTRGRLADISLAQGTTTFVTLLSIIKTLLFSYTKSPDQIIGMPVSGRNHPDLENQMGFFVNTLPLRTAVSPAAAFSQLVADVHQAVQDALANQDYPLEAMLNHLKRTTPVNDALFQVTVTQNISLSSEERSSLTMHGLKIAEYALETRTSPFAINFDVGSSGEGIIIDYHRDLFEVAAIQLMGARLEAIVKITTETPSLTLEEILREMDKALTADQFDDALLVDLGFGE